MTKIFLKYFSKGIVRRLNLIILTAIILGMVIYASLIGYYNYRATRAELEKKLKNTMDVAGLALEVPLWDVNERAIKKIGAAILSDKDFVAVSISDTPLNEGKSIELYKGISPNIKLTTIEELRASTKYLPGKINIVRFDTISGAEKKIGTLELFISTKRIANEFKETSLYLLCFTAILAIAIGAIVSAIGFNVIQKPILFLKEKAIDLTKGNLNVNIKMKREDELGSLANCFSQMRDAIKEKIDEISEYNRSLEAKVAERTKSLREKNAKIQTILLNIQQGILTISEQYQNENSEDAPNYIVDQEYSEFLEKILGRSDIQGKEIMELLFNNAELDSETLSRIKAALVTIMEENIINYQLNSDILISEFTFTNNEGKKKIIELDWRPITDEYKNVKKLMITLRDVTSLRKMQMESKRQKEELTIIIEIISVAEEEYRKFMKNTKIFLQHNMDDLNQSDCYDEDTVNIMLRNLHTIKGNARTFGFIAISQKAHEAEQIYVDMKESKHKKWDKQSLLKDCEDIHNLLQRYDYINKDVLGRKQEDEGLCKISKNEIELQLSKVKNVNRNDLAALNGVVNELSKFFSSFSGAKLSDILSVIKDSTKDIAISLGKEIPMIEIIEDENIYLKGKITDTITNVFSHLIRNSIDHGIEPPNQRMSLGKSKKGHIKIESKLADNSIVLSIQDDGSGIDLKKVKEKAVKMDLIGTNDQISNGQLAQFIFCSGFSTTEETTLLSGRGVGMDAVKNLIENEGGMIVLKSTSPQEKGSCHLPVKFEIRLPLSCAVIQSR